MYSTRVCSLVNLRGGWGGGGGGVEKTKTKRNCNKSFIYCPFIFKITNLLIIKLSLPYSVTNDNFRYHIT